MSKTSRRRPAFLTRDEWADRWDKTFNRNESPVPVKPKVPCDCHGVEDCPAAHPPTKDAT